ncbi:MAG: T9SS type A sorting domain-containing protein [Bacteroidota bacterium]
MIRRILKIIFLMLGIVFSTNAQDLPFFEGFESGLIPTGWTEQKIVGNTSWQYQEGGYSNNPDPLTKKPPHAHEGLFNAMFQVNANGPKTKLITRPLDLEFGIKPKLTLWHAQYPWGGETEFDKINIYYRSHIDSSWNLLLKLDEVTEGWAQKTIFLPDSTLSSTYYLAFEGESNWGWGACLDNIEIVETGFIPKHIVDVTYHENNQEYLATDTKNNPLYRIDIEVFGNSGNLLLDSLILQAANTSNEDIDSIRIFWTEDKIFNQDNPVCSGTYSAGMKTFNDINFSIPYGNSYLWIAHDIDSLATEKNQVNFNIPENGIRFILDTIGISIDENLYLQNDTFIYVDQEDLDTLRAPLISLYPGEQKSLDNPPSIKSNIFFDSFETDLGWNFTGEFERGQPQGLGGAYGGVSDPDHASDQEHVIGTDLSGAGSRIGDYENGILESNPYLAISPTFSCKYYKDIDLSFDRWLNIEIFDYDRAFVELSLNDGDSWKILWKNSSTEAVNENSWTPINLDLSALGAERIANCKIRFRLGPTDATGSRSGWNIDRFLISGDYIANDIAIAEIINPLNGCGHTANEPVSVKIKNHGPSTSKDTIPLFYSFDNGNTIITDTLFNSNLAPEDSIIFTFDTPIDLSAPGLYDVIIACDLPEDEYRINDTIKTQLVVQPTVTLPYTELFESEKGLWLTNGNNNNTWAWGTPSAGAYSGSKAWATNLNGNYKNSDSSWVESVCYNFADTFPKIIDFRQKVTTQEKTDGAFLQYSTDGGNTWHIADTHAYAFDWNWYTDTIASAKGEPGWTGHAGTWTRNRQVLPAGLNENSSVKFRMHFTSDTATTYSGIVFDNMNIYNAPYDIGIVSVDSLTNACQFVNDEQVSVTIKNFGIGSLLEGDSIVVGVEASRNNPVLDTLILPQHLPVGDSVTLKLNKSINLDTAGLYEITAYTLIEDDPYFYSPVSNDTAAFSFYVHPNPVTDLADTIPTARPDTLTISAFYDPLYQYTWSPAGGENDSVYHVSSAGTYYLTVTNSDSTACVSHDSIHVRRLNPDLTVDSLANPISSCELSAAEQVTMVVKNIGTDTLNINDSIVLGYTFEGGLPVTDTFLIPERFYPDSTLSFTLTTGTVDMTSFAEYNFEAFLQYKWDTVQANDTLSTTVTTWGYPTVDLGPDQIIYTVEHIIDAGPGYSTYTWSTGGTARQDTVTEIGDYHVTITDVHGCPDSDTVHIQFDYLDVGVTALINPIDQCMPQDSLQITSTFTNTGTDTIFSGTDLDIGYRVNGGLGTIETISLQNDLFPDSSIIYTFDKKYKFPSTGDYYLESYSLIPGDINTANDTIGDTISIYPYPTFDLGEDTLVKAYEYELAVPFIAENTYQWNTGADTSGITITTPDTYSLSVTSQYGCMTEDSVQVTIVVPDLAVTNLIYPGTSCLPKHPVNPRVNLYNNGTDTIYAGETITMGYIVNETDITTEPYTLTSNLNPNTTMTYDFASAYNFTQEGSVDFDVFVVLEDEINSSNDTLSETFTLYPYPDVELGNDTLVKDYSFTLDAGYDPTYNYIWNTGEDSSQITVSTTNTYTVSVTSPEGCEIVDSRFVNLKVPDIEVSEIIVPETSCLPKNPVNVRVRLHNNGTDTVYTGETIDLGYSIDGAAIVAETLPVTADFLPGSTLDYSFTESHIFTEEGAKEVTAFAIMEDDIDHTNDTLIKNFNLYEYASVELGNDTLIKWYEYTLDAGYDEDYAYLWNTGETTADITISNSGMYAVSVTTENGCITEDTINIIMQVPDLELHDILTPVSQCMPESPTSVSVEIYNSGTDTLFSGESIQIGYTINGGEVTQNNYVLTDDFLPDESMNYEFSDPEQFTLAGEKIIQAFITMDDDINSTNDTLSSSIYIYDYPEVELGEDSLIKQSSYRLIAGNNPAYTYLWQDGSSDSTFTATSNGAFEVTVTSPHGCTTEDEIRLTFTFPDMGAVVMTAPTDLCDFNAKTVVAEFENMGTDTIAAGETLAFSYRVNGENEVSEDVIISDELLPGERIEHQFNTPVDMSEEGDYELKIFTSLLRDLDHSNDTITEVLTVLEAPEVDFGDRVENDTIKVPFPTSLDAGSGFVSYNWSNGQRSRIHIIQNPGYYEVTVTNQNGCEGSGGVFVDSVSMVEPPDTCCGGDCDVDTCDTYVETLLSEQISFNIYPNPMTEKVVIDITSAQPEVIYYTLYNTAGQAVLNRQINVDGFYRETIKTANFPSGIYNLKIYNQRFGKSYRLLRR